MRSGIVVCRCDQSSLLKNAASQLFLILLCTKLQRRYTGHSMYTSLLPGRCTDDTNVSVNGNSGFEFGLKHELCLLESRKAREREHAKLDNSRRVM